MYNLTDRKIKIGIYSGIFLILLFLIKSFYEYFGNEQISYFHQKQILILATFYFLFINLLILLYNIVVNYYNQIQLKSYFKWLIRLEIMVGFLAILTSFATHYGIVGAFLAVRLVSLVIYIIIFSKLFKIEKEELPDIIELQFLVSAYVLILAIGFVISYYQKQELEFLNHLLKAIPFIFIIRFLMKFRRREYKNRTANV